MKRTPGFTITVVLSLVLGVSAVGSMFAIVYGVLLAPLPYGQPERLVSVELQSAELARISHAPALYFTYQRFAQRLAGVGLYRTGSSNVRSSGEGADAQSVIATWITASMVPLLRVPPLLGRSFTAEEEIRGGPNAVILSEAEWRIRFSAATDVIGKTLIVNDAPREIVGVMPARFSFPTAATRLWLPVKTTNSATVDDFSYSAVARLALGASAKQAQDELAALLPRVAESFPHLQSGSSTMMWLADVRPSPVVTGLRDQLTRGIGQTLWMLAAAAGLVLLVAWANVANLMLVRSESHKLELSVREALGAGRLRLASHALSESLLLSAAAGALALLVTHGAIRALVVFGPADVPRLAELGIGLMTTGFIVLVTVVGAILCAAVPTVRVRPGRLLAKLQDGARGQSTGKSRQRVRATLTVVQIAVALVVTVGSLLLLRTAHRLSDVQPGFAAREVTTLRILLPFARYSGATTVAFYARLTELVGQMPSVRAVGLIGQLPLAAGWTEPQTFLIDGAARTQPLPVNVAGNGYFSAMQIPLLAGSDFRRLDLPQSGDIVISQLAAASLFGDASGQAAVGKHLTLAPKGPTYTVVGVVGDVRDRDLASAPTAMIYRPQAVPIDASVEPVARPSMVLVVRSNAPRGALVAAIKQIMRDLDSTVPIFEVETMQDVVRASTARLSLTLTLMTAAAAITLLLGAIGLYGVMAYMVALRTREFGIRVALGAEPRRIARLVAARGLVLTTTGIAIGFGFYVLAAPLLRAFLYGVTTSDPVTLIGATLVLIGTAVLASVLPAHRAAHIDPAESLRAE